MLHVRLPNGKKLEYRDAVGLRKWDNFLELVDIKACRVALLIPKQGTIIEQPGAGREPKEKKP